MGEEFHYGFFRRASALEKGDPSADRPCSSGPPSPGERVLDVGCGPVAGVRPRRRVRASVLGITTSAGGVAAATTGCRRAAAARDSRCATAQTTASPTPRSTGVGPGVVAPHARQAAPCASAPASSPRGAARALRHHPQARHPVPEVRPGGTTSRLLRRPSVTPTWNRSRTTPATQAELGDDDQDGRTSARHPADLRRWRANATPHEDRAQLIGEAGVGRFRGVDHVLEAFWRDDTFGYGILAASRQRLTPRHRRPGDAERPDVEPTPEGGTMEARQDRCTSSSPFLGRTDKGADGWTDDTGSAPTASASTPSRRPSSRPCSRTSSGPTRSAGGELPETIGDIVAFYARRLRPNDRSARGAAAADAASERRSSPQSRTHYGDCSTARRAAAGPAARGITRFAIVEPDAAGCSRLLAGAALAGAEPCQYQPDTDARARRAGGALGHDVVVTRRTTSAAAPRGDPSPARSWPTHPSPWRRRRPRARPTPRDPDDRDDRGYPRRCATIGATPGPTGPVRPQPDQRWLSPTARTSSRAFRCCSTWWPAGRRSSRRFRASPRTASTPCSTDAVTCVSATPTFWRFLLAEARSREVRSRLEQITLGGEAGPADLLEELLPRSRGPGVPGLRGQRVRRTPRCGTGATASRSPSLWSATNPKSNESVERRALGPRRGRHARLLRGDTATADARSGGRPVTSSRSWVTASVPRSAVRDHQRRRREGAPAAGRGAHPRSVDAPASTAAEPLTGAIVAVEIVPVGASTRGQRRNRAAIREAWPTCRGPGSRGASASSTSRDPGDKTVRGTGTMSDADAAWRGDRWQPRTREPASSRPSSTVATASRPAPARRPTRSGPGERPRAQGPLPLHRPTLRPRRRGTFVKEAAARWGRIDVLVNNAGVAREGVIGLFGDEALDQVVDLNLKGTVYVTWAASRIMLARRGGGIVNISSVVGLSGYRGLAVYGATKAALDGFTRALAHELGSRGITVNSVAPGYLRTEMSHGLDEDQLGQIARRTPARPPRGARGRGAGRPVPRPTPPTPSSPARCWWSTAG